MKHSSLSAAKSAALLAAWLALVNSLVIIRPPAAQGYALNYTVADMRQSVSQSGGSACPQRNRFNTAVAGIIDRRWSTSLGTNPVTILTLDQTPDGRLNEIENAIQQSFSVWTGVANTTLGSALASLTRTTTQAACTSDGLNSICFNQSDPAFTFGVLSFTRVITADTIGAQPFPNNPPSSFVGGILDVDILLRPGDSTTTFATPAALPSQPNAYDLESVLAHELGHFFGLGHSGMWRAMMYAFVPPHGQFLGDRPTAQTPDAPLADDDRTGLRVLYPDPADTVHVGTISGRILPANPLSLPPRPAGVTGIFGAHIVAVNAVTGAVVAGTLAGWSCSDPGPPQFDGSYILERLPVGPSQSYKVYVEPLDGPVDAGEISGSVALCRNVFTDPGWPPQFNCTVPDVDTNFTTRVRPGP